MATNRSFVGDVGYWGELKPPATVAAAIDQGVGFWVLPRKGTDGE